jgi:hypothetical protein
MCSLKFAPGLESSEMVDLDRYADLQRLDTSILPIIASPGLAASAEHFAARFERAFRFLSATLNIAPAVGLAVLSAADWPRYAAIPIYAVTHYDYPRRMVVTAAESGTFWRPAIDFVQAHAPKILDDLRAVYGRPDGSIDLAKHIALWITHDLGHAFHLHAEYWFPRRWLMEYFADLCSYTYIAAVEPEQLPALETFMRALHAVEARHLPYHTWSEFERLYGDETFGLENYLWYHGHLYASAKRAYQAAGVQVLVRMWQGCVLADVREISDDQLANLLDQIQPELAQMLRAWPAYYQVGPLPTTPVYEATGSASSKVKMP